MVFLVAVMRFWPPSKPVWAAEKIFYVFEGYNLELCPLLVPEPFLKFGKKIVGGL